MIFKTTHFAPASRPPSLSKGRSQNPASTTRYPISSWQKYHWRLHFRWVPRVYHAAVWMPPLSITRTKGPRINLFA